MVQGRTPDAACFQPSRPNKAFSPPLLLKPGEASALVLHHTFKAASHSPCEAELRFHGTQRVYLLLLCGFKLQTASVLFEA